MCILFDGRRGPEIGQHIVNTIGKNMSIEGKVQFIDRPRCKLYYLENALRDKLRMILLNI